MAENEEIYLRQCMEQNICPVCQHPIVKRVGSGQLKDGAFCSLDCFTKWNETLLIRRHNERIQKKKLNESSDNKS